MAIKKTDYIKVTEMNVENVRLFKAQKRGASDVIFFTLTLNQIKIYNCQVRDSRNGEFIAFPQYKGNDGNYYSYVWAKLSEADQETIIEEVKAQL